MTFNEKKSLLDTMSKLSDNEGIVDIRKVSFETKRTNGEIERLANTVGFRWVDTWRINTKIIDV